MLVSNTIKFTDLSTPEDKVTNMTVTYKLAIKAVKELLITIIKANVWYSERR